MISMIGSAMPNELIARLYREDAEIREFIDNRQQDAAISEPWSQQPRDMHLRLWPQRDITNFAGRFRYRIGEQREEWPVRFLRDHSQVPMNSDQYRLWDQTRTEVALGHYAEPQRIWTGMAQWPDSNQWNQSHFFLLVAGRTNPWTGVIIGLHPGAISYPGHWAREQDRGYRDWRFDSRRPVLWK